MQSGNSSPPARMHLEHLLLVPQVTYAVARSDIGEPVDSLLDEDLTDRLDVPLRQTGMRNSPVRALPVTIGCPEPATDPLEEVRQSFMRMAPEAFELSEITGASAFWERRKMTKSQEVEFWTKVWESFDFGAQQIDTRLPGEEQPRDVQILLAALGATPKTRGKNRIKQGVRPAARNMDTGDRAYFSAEVECGGDRLRNMLKFKHGLQPIPTAPEPISSPVPFPWLDPKLSHFKHLGWRLLDRPTLDDEVIDYNDAYDVDDPYRRDYRESSDHFRRWMYGGLLMVGVRWS